MKMISETQELFGELLKIQDSENPDPVILTPKEYVPVRG